MRAPVGGFLTISLALFCVLAIQAPALGALIFGWAVLVWLFGALAHREPSPGVWLAERVDDLGFSLYVVILICELIVIWVQYGT